MTCFEKRTRLLEDLLQSSGRFLKFRLDKKVEMVSKFGINISMIRIRLWI
jgi:hypothetical protein